MAPADNFLTQGGDGIFMLVRGGGSIHSHGLEEREAYTIPIRENEALDNQRGGGEGKDKGGFLWYLCLRSKRNLTR